MGGTITGEHGVGVEKRAYMPTQFSATDLEVMAELRRALDPLELANRGKMFPAADAPATGSAALVQSSEPLEATCPLNTCRTSKSVKS